MLVAGTGKPGSALPREPILPGPHHRCAPPRAEVAPLTADASFVHLTVRRQPGRRCPPPELAADLAVSRWRRPDIIPSRARDPGGLLVEAGSGAAMQSIEPSQATPGADGYPVVRRAHGSAYAELSRQIKRAGLLNRRPGYYIRHSALVLGLCA